MVLPDCYGKGDISQLAFATVEPIHTMHAHSRATDLDFSVCLKPSGRSGSCFVLVDSVLAFSRHLEVSCSSPPIQSPTAFPMFLQADLEKVDNEERMKREAEEAAAAAAAEKANKSLFGGTIWKPELEDDEEGVDDTPKKATKKKLRASDVIKGTGQIALGTIGEDEVFVEEEEPEQVKCGDNNDDDDDEDELDPKPKQQDGALLAS